MGYFETDCSGLALVHGNIKHESVEGYFETDCSGLASVHGENKHKSVQ